MARHARHSSPVAWLFALVTLLGACAAGEAPTVLRDVPVFVDRIAIDDNDAPVVVLEEQGGPRWLPIWIGSAEARSIALELSAHSPQRPNSHDLARNVIRHLDGDIDRVVVTELREGTYYAILAITLDSRTLEIDARPSDAIAIALRAGAPIFVRATVFEEAGSSSRDDHSPRQEI